MLFLRPVGVDFGLFQLWFRMYPTPGSPVCVLSIQSGSQSDSQSCLCLDLRKLDGSAFLEGLLGCDCDADGLKAVLAAYGDFLVVEDCVNKCLCLSDESG